MSANYDFEQEIANLAYNYKKVITAEKDYVGKQIEQAVLTDFTPAQVDAYLDIKKAIEKYKKDNDVTNKKKELSESKAAILDVIGEDLTHLYNNNSAGETGIMDYGFAKVSYEKKEEYALKMSDEERGKLLEQIIDMNLLDLIQLNDDKVINYALEQEKESGHLLNGVQRIVSFDVKVR